jgi:hypothetical protein
LVYAVSPPYEATELGNWVPRLGFDVNAAKDRPAGRRCLSTSHNERNWRTMTDHPGQPRVEINTTAIAAGAVIAVIGVLLVSVGGSIAGGTLVSAARSWVRQLETPPSETAKTVLRQFGTAAATGISAGVGSWQGPST